MTWSHRNWLADRFAGLRATVIGDVLLDRFVECEPRKLCSEGPVPVVWRQRDIVTPGGAANVAANLAALGARVTLAGVTGRDDAGRELRRALDRLGVRTDHLVADADSRTHRKDRILAAGQYVVRVDDGRTAAPDRRIREAVDAALAGAEVVLLSDYDLGVFGAGLVAHLARARPDVPVVVDAKQPGRFRRLRPSAVTPNLPEATALAGRGGEPADLALRVRAATAAELVALTLGDGGAYLLDGDGLDELLPARPAAPRSDVGAGDSFVSALGLALAAGAGSRQAAIVAIEAAGIAVTKPYTAVVTAEELSRSLAMAGEEPAAGGEEAGLSDLLAALDRRRRRGQRIVFTNGVFDLLHPGHVDLLRQARRLGDALVVAVNSDASVHRLKGPGRPVQGEAERLELVAALDCVDHVLRFDADTASGLLRAIRPAIYVKGGDHSEDDLPEAEAARRLGTRVVILPRTLPASTTSLIQRVARLGADAPPAAGG